MVKSSIHWTKGADLSRPSNLLERNPASFSQDNPLTSIQTQVDGMTGSFVSQMTDWKSLAALIAGGMAYRVGRIGVMGLGNGNVVRALSVGTGLTAEVSTFEVAHRSLHSLHPDHSNLWRWSGPLGLQQGLLSSLITFGAIKGLGKITQAQNLILQHGAQATGMVVGHQLAYQAGGAPKPQGSLAEQFLHAEATNLQLGAGMSLLHGLAPGIHAWERGLNLGGAFPPNFKKKDIFRGRFGFFFEPLSATASASREPSSERESNHIKMSSLPKGSSQGGEGPTHFESLVGMRRRIASPQRLGPDEGGRFILEIINMPAESNLFEKCEALVALGFRRDFFDYQSLMGGIQNLIQKAKLLQVEMSRCETIEYIRELNVEAEESKKSGVRGPHIESHLIDSIVGQAMDFFFMTKKPSPLPADQGDPVYAGLLLASLIALSSAPHFQGRENVQKLVELVQTSGAEPEIIDFTLALSLSRAPLTDPAHWEIFFQAVDGLADPPARVRALTERALSPNVGVEGLRILAVRIAGENAAFGVEADSYLKILEHRSIYEQEILEMMAQRIILLMNSEPSFAREERFMKPLEKIVSNPAFTQDAMERIADKMAIIKMDAFLVFHISQRLHRVRGLARRFEN